MEPDEDMETEVKLFIAVESIFITSHSTCSNNSEKVEIQEIFCLRKTSIDN